ncbi:MAG: hypothetical protein NTY39_05045 [Campylobacterales bacterium]|nr:hypothetical protein [Campylobacterales bacterium]
MDNKQFDISKLKPIAHGSIFVRLDKNYDSLLSAFPETLERANMSLHFAQYIGSHKDDIKKAEGYFRASLYEFVSMEEALKRESKLNVNIFSTKNPLLILLKLLRNLEVHLKTRKLYEQPRQYLWEYTQEVIDTSILVVDTIELSDIQKLDGYKHYFKHEDKNLIQTLHWFNNAIDQWGIIQLMTIGVNEYANEIVSNYIDKK